VASVLVLLRPTAQGPATNGVYRVAVPGSQPHLIFRYTMRRIWREPATDLLSGALGTLPLAPLGAVRRADLPDLLRAVDRRFAEEAPAAEAARLRVVTYTLLGLRYPATLVDQIMPGLRSMRDSSTYMAIIEEGLAQGRAQGRAEGRAEGERRLLLLFGEARFGPPDDPARSRLEAISDIDVLERLARRLMTVSSWSELLADQA
jgi:hypothetical protein